MTAQLKKMWGAVCCAILEWRIIGNFLWCWSGGIWLLTQIALLSLSSREWSKKGVQHHVCKHLGAFMFGMPSLLLQGGFWLQSMIPFQLQAALCSVLVRHLESICSMLGMTCEAGSLAASTSAYKNNWFVLLCFWRWKFLKSCLLQAWLPTAHFCCS